MYIKLKSCFSDKLRFKKKYILCISGYINTVAMKIYMYFNILQMHKT